VSKVKVNVGPLPPPRVALGRRGNRRRSSEAVARMSARNRSTLPPRSAESLRRKLKANAQLEAEFIHKLIGR
jgi:hypothetical protein